MIARAEITVNMRITPYSFAPSIPHPPRIPSPLYPPHYRFPAFAACALASTPTISPLPPQQHHRPAPTSPSRILQQRRIHRLRRQMHISHRAPADKHVLDGIQVRPAVRALRLARRRRRHRRIAHGDVFQLDVEELVDGFQAPGEEEVILELDGDLGGLG